jgi:hypothetical protein
MSTLSFGSQSSKASTINFLSPPAGKGNIFP